MTTRRLPLVTGALLFSAFVLPPLVHAQDTTATQSDLQLTFSSPSGWSSTGYVGSRDLSFKVASSIRVSGNAKYQRGGVDSVLLGGYPVDFVPYADGTVEFDGYIRVEQRMDTATVVVVTSFHTRITRSYKITPVEPPPPPPGADPYEVKAADIKFTGRRWAVVIGISNYQDPEVPQLKYAATDAWAFYDFIRSPLAGGGGFEAANIRVLLDREATYTAVHNALRGFLSNVAPEDMVYIYIAGHGSPDPSDLKKTYFLTYDTPRKNIGTGYAMDDIIRDLKDVKATHKILITDACHSGVMGEGRGLDANDISEAFNRALSKSKGVDATFTAAKGSEIAQEGDQWRSAGEPAEFGGHGAFTYHLLQGLKGNADRNGDHIVDLAEMYQYVYDSVSSVTHGVQHPNRSSPANYDASFPMAAVMPGTVVKHISTDAIDSANKASILNGHLAEFQWSMPDSVQLVLGTKQPMAVRLKNDDRDVVPNPQIRWSSSKPDVATVDSNGVVTPRAAGSATITAAYYVSTSHKAVTRVDVLPRPSEVKFAIDGLTLPPAPTDSVISVVTSETFKVKSDLLIGDQWTGKAPLISGFDTLFLKVGVNETFTAARPGTTVIYAAIAGFNRTWTIHVVAPRVKIKRNLPLAMALNDSATLSASRVRADGSALGDASISEVSWKSLDTSLAIVRGGKIITRGIGKARITGTLGDFTDTISTFVLGDLLVSTDSKGGPAIMTVSRGTTIQTVQLPVPKEMAATEAALSPKGNRIVFVSKNRLYLMDPDGGNIQRLTQDAKGLVGVRTATYYEKSPTWTHDASHVLFISNAYGNNEVISISTDGKQELTRITSTGQMEDHVAAASDGPRIAFDRTSGSNGDVVVTMLDGSQEQIIPRNTNIGVPHYANLRPQFLPDGQHLIYVKKLDGAAGEALFYMDINKPEDAKELVKPQKNTALIFTLSPDGKYAAYHFVADEFGTKNSVINIMDLDNSGGTQMSVTLGNGVDIKSVSWGASNSAKGGK